MQSYAINKVGTQSFAGFGDDGNHSDARTIDDQVQYRADEVQRTHRGHLCGGQKKALFVAGREGSTDFNLTQNTQKRAGERVREANNANQPIQLPHFRSGWPKVPRV